MFNFYIVVAAAVPAAFGAICIPVIAIVICAIRKNMGKPKEDDNRLACIMHDMIESSIHYKHTHSMHVHGGSTDA